MSATTIPDQKETAMGLLDQILGGLAGGGMGRMPGAQAGGGGGLLMALLPVVLSMLAQRQRGGSGGTGGGLGGLLEEFTRRGYGQQAQSWVGTGQNDPLPPQALDDVFGHDEIA